MKRKMTSALSLFLTAAMLGTSVPSVVLAEDFSQQPCSGTAKRWMKSQIRKARIRQ